MKGLRARDMVECSPQYRRALKHAERGRLVVFVPVADGDLRLWRSNKSISHLDRDDRKILLGADEGRRAAYLAGFLAKLHEQVES